MKQKMSHWEVERFINQMIKIEDFLYNTIESQWTTPEILSMQLTQSGLYLNDRLIDGSQADEIIKSILKFYKKVQEHYRDPDFQKMLNPIEQRFPDRSEYQIGVVDDIHNPGKIRIRKRLFRQLADRYPEKFQEREPYVEPKNLIRSLSQYGSGGVYFYGEDVRDWKKIWIDPGAIELFLNLLFEAKKRELCIHRIIKETCPEYLKGNWFIIPEKKEYHPRFIIATLRR